MKSKHSFALSFSVLLLVGGHAPGEDAPSPATVPEVQAELQLELDKTSWEIEQLLREFDAANQRVENRVKMVVDHLKGRGDSRNTNVMVLRVKEDVMFALLQTLEGYLDERKELAGLYWRARLDSTRDEIAEQIAFFEKGAEKGVDQIIELTASLAKDTNFHAVSQKNFYQSATGRRRRSASRAGAKRDHERHYRLVGGQGGKTITEVKTALEDEVESLARSIAHVREDLKQVESPAVREVVQDYLQQGEKLIDKRLKQILALTPTSEAKVQSISSLELERIRKALGTVKVEIDQDLQEMVAVRKKLVDRLNKRRVLVLKLGGKTVEDVVGSEAGGNR